VWRLIYASSMVMLDSRRKMPVSALARWLLGLGIAATLAANIAHGLGHGRFEVPMGRRHELSSSQADSSRMASQWMKPLS
jgi:hypothetical protein